MTTTFKDIIVQQYIRSKVFEKIQEIEEIYNGHKDNRLSIKDCKKVLPLQYLVSTRDINKIKSVFDQVNFSSIQDPSLKSQDTALGIALENKDYAIIEWMLAQEKKTSEVLHLVIKLIKKAYESPDQQIQRIGNKIMVIGITIVNTFFKESKQFDNDFEFILSKLGNIITAVFMYGTKESIETLLGALVKDISLPITDLVTMNNIQSCIRVNKNQEAHNYYLKHVHKEIEKNRPRQLLVEKDWIETARQMGYTGCSVETATLILNIIQLVSDINNVNNNAENGLMEKCINAALTSVTNSDLVKFLITKTKYKLSSDVMDLVAEKGDVELIKILHKRGDTCSFQASSRAMCMGHVKVVDFLLENTNQAPPPSYFSMYLFMSNTEMFRYLLPKLGKPIKAAKDIQGAFNSLEMLTEFINTYSGLDQLMAGFREMDLYPMETVALRSKTPLQILQMLHSKFGFRLRDLELNDKKTKPHYIKLVMKAVCESPDLDEETAYQLVKYLYENKYPFSNDIIMIKHLSVVKYMHEVAKWKFISRQVIGMIENKASDETVEYILRQPTLCEIDGVSIVTLNTVLAIIRRPTSTGALIQQNSEALQQVIKKESDNFPIIKYLIRDLSYQNLKLFYSYISGGYTANPLHELEIAIQYKSMACILLIQRHYNLPFQPTHLLLACRSIYHNTFYYIWEELNDNHGITPIDWKPHEDTLKKCFKESISKELFGTASIIKDILNQKVFLENK